MDRRGALIESRDRVSPHLASVRRPACLGVHRHLYAFV